MALPKSFILSHSIFRKFNIPITFDNNPGIPTTYGLLVHSFFFFISVYIILSNKISFPNKQQQKIHINMPDNVERII